MSVWLNGLMLSARIASLKSPVVVPPPDGLFLEGDDPANLLAAAEEAPHRGLGESVGVERVHGATAGVFVEREEEIGVHQRWRRTVEPHQFGGHAIGAPREIAALGIAQQQVVRSDVS